jgi:phosphohistidine phosphatase
MKTLLILRHAKSSRDEPELADHDRPLNERGKKAAKEAGRFLRDEDLVPDLIVSSTALRARKTAQKAAKQCEYPRAIELEEQLYLGNAPTHYKVVRKADASCKRLLIVGHNPGISEFLSQLVSGSEEDMPTAGLAVVQLPIRAWKELTARTRGKVLKFWRPRDSN